MKRKIAFALIMGLITTGIVSFTLICVNLGFSTNFFKVWLKSWSIAYVVAIPAILVIAPKIQQAVDRWFSEAEVLEK